MSTKRRVCDVIMRVVHVTVIVRVIHLVVRVVHLLVRVMQRGRRRGGIRRAGNTVQVEILLGHIRCRMGIGIMFSKRRLSIEIRVMSRSCVHSLYGTAGRDRVAGWERICAVESVDGLLGIGRVCVVVVLVVGIAGIELCSGVGVSGVSIRVGIVAIADGRKGGRVSHVTSDHGGRTSRKVVVTELVINESSRAAELGSIKVLFFHFVFADSTDDECNDNCNDKDSSNRTKDGTNN